MANTKRHFIAGKMNKSVDERLLPNGEYVDALNVRLGSTEASEIGSVENSKGNTQLSTLEYNGTPLSSNAKCIGAYEDGARETIYWFVHDPNFSASVSTKLDLIVSLNVNGLKNKKKRNTIFHWLNINKYDILCNPCAIHIRSKSFS